jgi:autotransporter-associated beta strand protein
LDPTTGSLNPTTQKIFFNLPADPVAGAQAAIYFGFAADFQGPIIVTVNGVNVTTPSTGFFPWYSGANSGDDAMIRMASHGIFCDDWLNFAAGNLHQGQNEIDLQMRNGGNYKYGVNYDYIRLELTGYIPPAPPGLTAIPGNGLVVLEWPASSGATSYNVLRSTTAGADYAILATNVTGPVVGSDVPDATYTDSSVVNGAPYYYVVSAVNPNGQSTNSVEAGATPSSSTPPAPPAPTGLTATAGNSQVILNWSASPGAATYAIQRAPLTIGAVTTSPDGSNPTNVVNSFVTTTNYTDTGLANNVTYAYEVSAANANGQSVNSVAVSATPLPVFPVPPAGFSATVASNLVSLVWTPATNASSYVLQRATSISGPYTTIEDPAWLTMYSDGPLSANTTYYYEIASANLAGISANSAPLTVVVQPAAPVLTADSGDAEVFLNWTASPGATNYVLEGSTTNGGPYSPVISTTNTSDVITGLLNGTTYYYVVYSLGFYGQSPLSAEAAATPEVAPGGFYWANTITSAAQNWNTNANWTNAAAFPNQSEAVAVVNSAIAANQTINLNQAITIGALYLGAPAGSAVFNIAGNGGTLTLDNTPAPATLVELSTANGDTVSTPITVTGGLQITNASSNTLTLSGGISGAVNGVSVSGNTLLSGSNTYTGGTVLNQGTLVFSLGAAIPASGALTLNNTGAVTVATASSLPDVLVNGANAITGNGGSGTGIATLNVAGTLTLLVAGGSDVFDLTGPMSGSGGVVLGSSPMTLRFNGTAGDGGAIFNLGTGAAVANVRKVVTTAIALGGLAGGSGTQLQGDNNPGGLNVTYTIGGANANTEFDGVIKDGTVGAVALTKTGASALLLTGMNNYSGGTTIGGGMLIINNTAGSGTGSGAVTVSSGGALGGTGLLSGAVTVNSGGLLAPGNPPAALTFGKSLTLAAGSTTLLAVCQSPLTNSATVVLGGLTNGGTLIITNSGGAELKGGDTFTLLRAGSYSGAFAGVVLPPLNPALAWKTNLLNTAGTVSVVVATQPLFQPLSTSPQGLVFAGSNGPANALYCLLSSTNPAALLSNWTPVVTNFFDAGGDFNFTNPPAPGQPQQFFILEIP